MKNILIVDDNSATRSALDAVLKEAGYAAAMAENGAEALELARRSPPDLVISDILMPVVDGYELCRLWKADDRLKRIPFIFYTATYTDLKDQRFGLGLGAERFLIKPMKIELLKAVVSEVLEQGRTGGAPYNPLASAAVPPEKYSEVISRKLEYKVAELEKEVAARRKAQLELEEASLKLREKSLELSDFFYITSHDLRTPLMNIQGFSANLLKYIGEVSSLLKSGGKDADRLGRLLDEQIPEALHFIGSGADNMGAMITGLLKVSRAGGVEMKFKPVDMEALVAGEAAKMSFQLKEAGAEVKIRKLPGCVADAEQLGHVFCNLLHNSISYRDPSRKLVIEISGTRLDSGACSYTISDNGRGVTPEEAGGKIWQLFYRAAPNGPEHGEGVGLTISKRIVEKHGGTIRASQAPGGGTSFTLELPARAETGVLMTKAAGQPGV